MLVKLAIWRKSLFARMLITFLITMLPIYYIGTGIYNWGVSTVKNEIISSKSQQMSVYIANLENDIQRLKTLQSDCLMSKEINLLSNGQALMDDYTKFDYMLRLQQRLWTVKNSSPLVGNAAAYIPKLGRTIPAFGSIDDITDKDLQKMRLFNNGTFSQAMCDGNTLFFNLGFPTYANPSYAVTISLSTDELRKSLVQFNTYSGSGTALYSGAIRFFTSSGGAEGLAVQIAAYVDASYKDSASGVDWHKFGNKQYLVLFERSKYLGMTVCQFVPQDQIFVSMKKYQFWFWLFTISSAVIIAAFSFTTYGFIQKPIRKLIKSFQRLENGDMSFEIKHKYNDEIENLYEHFNGMMKKLDLMIKHEYLQEIMVKRAELKQLQSQINPHFLYNSFFILYTMTRRGEYEMLERFELQLGEYFQFLTRSSSDEVPLAKEAEHARTYCDIQSLRFSNRIAISFGELPAGYGDVMVPRLILQPIIENAFEHGLESKEENGLLQISFSSPDGALVIVIEDNGDGLTDEDVTGMQRALSADSNDIETTGTVNIHRRIRLKFGAGSGLTVSRGESGGLRVAITLEIWGGRDVQNTDC